MKTTTKNPQIRDVIPVRYLFGSASALLFTTLAFGQAVDAQKASQKDDILVMESYKVVGSRLTQLDTKTISPVLVMDNKALEAKGFPTFADAVRSLSFNNGQALTPVDAGTSFTPGINTFNLRGLGNNSSLVLINGRRTAAYAAPGSDGLQSMFDLNSVPDAAIDSIEILKDGGSAIYGSDAVAGVMNIKLRQSYSGAEVSIGYGDFFNTSGAVKTATIVTGATSGKASIIVAASWRDQGRIMARDLWYARDADNTSVAGKANPYYVLTVGNLQELYDPGILGLTDPVSYGWFDYRSSMGFPGFVATAGSWWTFDASTSEPTVEDAVEGYNPYNYQQDTTFTDSRRTYSFFTRAQYDFNRYVSAALELSLVHNESQTESAPTPIRLDTEQGLTVGSKMYIPAGNPYNPWNEDIYGGRRRLVEAGNRINDVTADSPRVLLALNGKFSENTFLKDWDWDTGVMLSRSSVTNSNAGNVPDYRLQQALLGLVEDENGNFEWDPTAAANGTATHYFNWFGYNDPRMGKFLTVHNPAAYKNELTSYDIHASGPVAQLLGGALGVSLGFERYTQKSGVYQSDLNSTANIVGGSINSSWEGSRTVNAFYAEAVLPVTKWFEAQVAGRFETYSDDGFQERVRPKAGLKFRPLDWLIIRGSYAQSYKAPDLAYLYTSMMVQFTGLPYRDPAHPSQGKQQLEMHVLGESGLKPETTDSYYAGIAIEPRKGPLKGLSASVDIFYYKQKDLLAQITDFYDMNEVLAKALDPANAIFYNMVKRGPSSTPGTLGEILYIDNQYGNIGSRETTGMDLEFAYQWRTERMGNFRAALQGTYNASDKIDGDSVLGNAASRRFNGNIGINWDYRTWAANVTCQYIRGTDDASMLISKYGWDDYGVASGPDEPYGDLYAVYHIKSQYIFNAQLIYRGFKDIEMSLGVTNIFNQRPPVYPDGTGGAIVPGVNWVEPASWFIKLTKKF